MVGENKVGNIAQQDITQKDNVKKIMGAFLALSSIQILHFPNELYYCYLSFEGNGKIPFGR